MSKSMGFRKIRVAVFIALTILAAMVTSVFGAGDVTTEKWVCSKTGVELAGNVSYAEGYLSVAVKGSYLVYKIEGRIELKGDKITGRGRFTSWIAKDFTLTMDAKVAKNGSFKGVVHQIFDSGERSPYHFRGKMSKDGLEGKHFASTRAFIGRLERGGLGLGLVTTKRGRKLNFTARRVDN